MTAGKVGFGLRLDPRAELLMLLMANIVAFTYQAPWIEFLIIGLLALLQICCGCTKTAVKWLCVFAALLLIQKYAIPRLPKMIAAIFSILAVYARRIFPCFMMGAVIIRTTPVRSLIAALQKWHVSQKIIIPLAVTLRYFPTIREERRHIRDAMKLKKIKGLGTRIECRLVPILMSAIKTSDELSAAAITRGIENPGKKTCVIDLRFRVQDYVCLALGLVLMGLALFIH